MERGLLVIALVLSLVVGGVGLMPPRKPVAFPWQSALPALLAFVLSLPSSGIFAPGQALGLGVLLGGVFGALAGWLALQERPTAAAGLALAPLLLLLSLHSMFPRENLLGATLGLLAALCVIGWRSPGATPALTLVGALTVGVATASCLGTFRPAGTIKTGWLSFPLVLTAGALVLATVLGQVKVSASRLLIGAVGYALLLALAVRPLALSTVGAPAPHLGSLGIALVLGLMLVWLAQADTALRRVLGVLLTLAALSGANHLGQGYGIALLLIGLAALALLTETVDTLLPALAAVALAALWRLVALRFDDARGFGLHEQYLLLGLLLGGLLPTLAAALGSLLGAGATLLALPAALTVLYGPRAGLTLVLGLLAGQLWSAALERTKSLAPLFALGVGTLLAQLLGHLAPLADKTRLVRLEIVGGIGLAWLIAAGIGYLIERKRP